MSSHHHVWLFSSIGTGHSSAPPGYSSLPIRLWFAGKSWKTKFLFLEVSRFLFYWKEPDFPFCLKRKPNCHFLLLSLAFDCKLVFLLLFQPNKSSQGVCYKEMGGMVEKLNSEYSANSKHRHRRNVTSHRSFSLLWQF